MKRLSTALIAALVGALCLPANGYGVDHVVLTLEPTKLAEKPAWRLTGTAGDFGGEIFGVTLEQSLLNGRAAEAHGLRANPRTPTLTFDGRAGRWDTRLQLGQLVTTRMTVTASGAPEPIGEDRGCRGAFARVPVVLRGTFVLRTGTRFFKTIRRSRLNGIVTFNQGGAVDCAPLTPSTCTPWTNFFVTKDRATVLAGPDSGGWLTLSFAETVGSSDAAATWYHVMLVSGFDPLAGQLPAIDVRVPSGLPIVGGGTFTAQQTSESASGACRTTLTSGRFTGTFRAKFTGWGARALVLRAHPAGYREIR